MSWQRTDARRRHVETVCETPPSRPADPLPVFAAEARDESRQTTSRQRNQLTPRSTKTRRHPRTTAPRCPCRIMNL